MAVTAERAIRRLTADEAIRMAEVGILRDDEPLELVDGVLVEMSPQGPLHSEAVAMLAERLRGAYAGTARIREEKPLDCGIHDLPEPDIAVVLGPAGAFAARHPSGKECLLVIEVAMSSQEHDRAKASVYAAAGVPVYWLVDLAARVLEVRNDPGYRSCATLSAGDEVELPRLGMTLAVSELFP